MYKIDFHTHILPKMDDGAASTEISLSMLSQLSDQGVSDVVLTPHYYSGREPMEVFLQRRRHSFEHLCESLPPDAPKVHLGCEVYFTEFLFNHEDLRPLCIDGTDVMLVELPGHQIRTEKLIDAIARLAADYYVTPVLAHIERFPWLWQHKRNLERLEDIGCLLQMNLSSFTVRGKGPLLKLAANGYLSAVGTDAHNTDSRAPEYDEGLAVLRESIGRNGIDDLQQSMADLLNLPEISE